MIRSRSGNSALLDEGPDTRLLASGRDALDWLIRSLRLAVGEQVLLPAYICEDVVKPFLNHGLAVEFYGVDSNLQADAADLARKLAKKTKLLLYIHYFGFPFELPEDSVPSKPTPTITVEDASHSLLSSFAPVHGQGDIRFASYRKLLPVPDGAIVSWNAERMPEFTPAETRRSIRSMAAVSCRCAGAGIKNLGARNPRLYPKRVHRWLFSWSEALLDSYPKPAGMSPLSRNVLSSLDLQAVVLARRRNFQFLLAGLSDVNNLRPLYASLPENVCPLGFPVLAEERDGLAKHLIQNRVFAPVHWGLPECVDRQEFPQAWSISSKILTIPVDQRYGEEDMARIVDLVRGYQESEAR